jgi:hypothetical protein
MGSEIKSTQEFQVKPSIGYEIKGDQAELFNNALYNIFVSNYLSDVTKNFHAFGFVDDTTGKVRALISFYESTEEPAWYYTIYRSSGDNNLLRLVLDEVIRYNENNGRLKFYTLVTQKHSKLLRRFHWSKYNDDRYGYFDEYIVPAKTKCFYLNAWELLYKRFILPENSVVRCNYLKQEHRTRPWIGGNI